MVCFDLVRVLFFSKINVLSQNMFRKMSASKDVWFHHFFFLAILYWSIIRKKIQTQVAVGGMSEIIVLRYLFSAGIFVHFFPSQKFSLHSTMFTNLCHSRPTMAHLLPLANKIAVGAMLIRLGLDVGLYLRMALALRPRGNKDEEKAQKIGIGIVAIIIAMDLKWTKEVIDSLWSHAHSK